MCEHTHIYIYIQVIDELCCERRCHFSKPHLLPMDFEKKGCLGEEGEVELEEKGKAFFHRVGNRQTEAAVFYMILRKLQHQ